MLAIEICIDVPDLTLGVRFYGDAFGFTKQSEPYPGVAYLTAGAVGITLLQKPEGSQPSRATSDLRRYARHWTPVHLDFHVDDWDAALARAVAAGASVEHTFDDPQQGKLAFCADPFGNGFCLLQRKTKRDAE